jgi:hypothetical protein
LCPDANPLRIAGIDTDAGLKRLGGKRERYESLLRKFAARQAGTVESIRGSLRGGADVLADKAAKVEAAIKSGHDIDDALFSLSQSLDQVLAGIRAVLPE